jgi:hypothetical protein
VSSSAWWASACSKGEQGGVERSLERRQVEPLGADPGPVALTPVLAGDVETPVPVQELQQPMAPAQDIATHVLPTPRQIANRFLDLVGDMDRRQLTGAKEPDQLDGVAAVGLDPLTRPARG